MPSFVSRFVTIAVGALIALAACTKQKLPSEDFAKASEIHSRLYAQEGDDAYLDPKMTEAETLLQRVPADSLDADAAHQLLDRIQKNRDRIKADRAQQQKAEADALAPMRDPFPDRPRPPAAETQDAGESEDAGPAEPRVGMSLGEFTQRFSGCFQPGQSLLIEGRGLRETWELKDIANCRDRHPGFDALILIIENGAIWNFGQKSAVQTTRLDGGASGGGGTPATPSGG